MKIVEEDVIKEFDERLKLFLESSSVQMWRSEVSELYGAIAGHQWTKDELDKRKLKNRPVDTINRMAPIIKAIAGYGVMNRTTIDIVPRKDHAPRNEEQESDVMGDAVEYLQDESDFYFESGLTTEDDYLCGIGATQTYFDYTDPQKPYGDVIVDRIFPGFLLYDNTCSKKNFKGALWAGRVEIVNRQWLNDEIKSVKGEDYQEDLGTRTTRGINDFLFFVDNVTTDDVDILYHYEWCEYVNTKTFSNIFIPIIESEPELMRMAAEFEEATGVDLSEPYITLDDSNYRKFREMLKIYHEMGNLDYREMIDATRGKRKKFYKARIARDVLLDATESWANDFTIQYKTGYYDELNRVFYGIGRAMLPVARLLNTAVSDYDSYLESVPKGGMYIEADAIDDPLEFKRTRANEQDLTLLKSGGLGKILEKSVPQVPGGLTDFIGLLSQLLPGVVGLPPDFLGQVQSGNMTNSLFSKIVKQAYMVLVHFNEAERVYMKRQGQVFIDAVRIISENYDGLLLNKVTNSGMMGEEFSLSKESLTRDYTLKVVERPKSEDEKVEEFQQIVEMAQVLANKPQPVDITPLLVEAWPYELEDKDAILQAMQPPPPPPPPQPDPMMQALLQAETQEKIAMAQLNAAKARKEMAELAEGERPDVKVTEKTTNAPDGITREVIRERSTN